MVRSRLLANGNDSSKTPKSDSAKPKTMAANTATNTGSCIWKAQLAALSASRMAPSVTNESRTPAV